MVEKYVKRPVIIEAVQWTGKNISEIEYFVGIDNCRRIASNSAPIGFELVIFTSKSNHYASKGDHYASIGDYIIKGIKGEFYPCKPDIFEQTYERVN